MTHNEQLINVKKIDIDIKKLKNLHFMHKKIIFFINLSKTSFIYIDQSKICIDNANSIKFLK